MLLISSVVINLSLVNIYYGNKPTYCDYLQKNMIEKCSRTQIYDLNSRFYYVFKKYG